MCAFRIATEGRINSDPGSIFIRWLSSFILSGNGACVTLLSSVSPVVMPAPELVYVGGGVRQKKVVIKGDLVNTSAP